MDAPIYIIGHKNPDTDSICSALTVADMKRRCGTEAVAFRLGPLNEETKFVLNRFHQEGPLLLSDARSTLKDIVIDAPTTITKDTTAYDAWKKMLNTKNRSLFVVEPDGTLCGLVSTSNLSLVRLLEDDKMEALMATAGLDNINEVIEGEIVVRPKNFSDNGKVNIITLDSNQTKQIELKDCICILSNDAEKQKQVVEQGVRCLILTCGQKAGADVIQLAKEKDCAVITTDQDTMHVARVILESFTVEHIMTKKVICFREDEFVEDVAAKMQHSRVRSYPVLSAEGKVVGAISRYHTQNFKKRQFILVDHSAKNQTINHIDEAEIVEIIDHHHIGDIQTDYPINYRNQKCGCTCTIVANMYQENGILPDEDMSGLLLSAILSDTLNFKSATTTKQDITTAKWLASRAGIEDLDAYAKEMLGASVALKDSTPKEILYRDLKMYTIGKYSLAIGQTNYSHIEDIQALLPKFREMLAQEQEEKKMDIMIMMFTHVMGEGTLFVYEGPLSYVLTEMLKTNFDDHFGFDPELISRKQQVIPKLSNILKSM